MRRAKTGALMFETREEFLRAMSGGTINGARDGAVAAPSVMALIGERLGRMLRENPALTVADAKNRLFSDDPVLYERYRREATAVHAQTIVREG